MDVVFAKRFRKISAKIANFRTNSRYETILVIMQQSETAYTIVPMVTRSLFSMLLLSYLRFVKENINPSLNTSEFD